MKKTLTISTTLAAAAMLATLGAPASAQAVITARPAATEEPVVVSAPDIRGALDEAARGEEILIVDQDLGSLIKDFARRFGIRAEIARSVRGHVRNLRVPSEPTAFLDELSRRFQIDWFFEGQTLHVSSVSEAASRMIGLQNIPYETVRDEISEAGLDPDRFGMKHMPTARAVLVSGPPSYIARVELIVESLIAGRPAVTGVRMVKFGIIQHVPAR